MPFNWRSLIPYGFGRLIPNPAASPSYTIGNWGQTGSPNDPAAGMSAFGSSVTPTVFTPNAAPSTPDYGPLTTPGFHDPSAPAIPTPVTPDASVNPFAPAGPQAITPSQNPFTPNANPGSTGTASVDLGPAPKVAMLGGHAL